MELNAIRKQYSPDKITICTTKVGGSRGLNFFRRIHVKITTSIRLYIILYK